MKTDRYHLIDTLRGFALINMFVYHALWSMANIFHYKISWFPSFHTYLWQQSGASLFIILSGFCWALSKKHLKRSLVVLSCALFIFICTYFFSKSSVITFGILSFIGSAMLIMLPLAKMLRYIPPYCGFLLSIVLFFTFKNIAHGCIGFMNWQYTLPPDLYANNLTAYIGLPPQSFHSADYFPLLPWIFMYTAGYFIYYCIQKSISKNNIFKFKCKPLSLLGRHSLAAYLIHQPVIIVFLWICFKVIG